MNKKAQASKTIMKSMIYLIVIAGFFATMVYYVANQKNNSAIYAEYFSKDISKVIDSASSEETIEIDVQEAVKIARDNQVSSSEIFTFDNQKNQICVRLSKNRKTCNYYFNNVDVVEQDIKPGLGKDGKAILSFKITEKRK